jgi:hypothetical protein
MLRHWMDEDAWLATRMISLGDGSKVGCLPEPNWRGVEEALMESGSVSWRAFQVPMMAQKPWGFCRKADLRVKTGLNLLGPIHSGADSISGFFTERYFLPLKKIK